MWFIALLVIGSNVRCVLPRHQDKARSWVDFINFVQEGYTSFHAIFFLLLAASAFRREIRTPCLVLKKNLILKKRQGDKMRVLVARVG